LPKIWGAAAREPDSEPELSAEFPKLLTSATRQNSQPSGLPSCQGRAVDIS
jgi:hypothetical protein